MRIHFLLKLIIGAVITILYGWIVLDEKFYIFESGHSINMDFGSNLAHLLTVVTLLLILHFIDRQMEYISRVDYK